MNLSQFFEHWSITENPFRGEEARQDAVFQRLAHLTDDPAGPTPDASAAVHSDFEKILGDPARPATAIVFGEKGSGKTAIRLQIADRVARHNQRNPDARVLLVPYDELNAVLARFHDRAAGKDPLESFERLRLVDHIDAILGQVVPRLADALLTPPGPDPLDLGPEPRKAARRLDPTRRRDLLLLQAIYDRPDGAPARTSRLRAALRLPRPRGWLLWSLLASLGWIPAAGVIAYAVYTEPDHVPTWLWAYAALALAGLWVIVLLKRFVWDRLALQRAARRVRRQHRVSPRPDGSYADSLRQLATPQPDPLPAAEPDEARYAMLARLRAVLAGFAYAGIIVVVDRVDEPTLVSGDARRMRAIVWPLLNNKFLQQEGLGVKLLLPIELRHALFKESSAFFQEARLDKQNLIERLSWTGAMLYDLCEARLRACRSPGAAPAALLDLFAEDVTRKDLVDALDQMHQPRDAFKFLYRCMAEHCSNVTHDQNEFRIPRLVLETVRKQESERVQQLYRGIRPG